MSGLRPRFSGSVTVTKDPAFAEAAAMEAMGMLAPDGVVVADSAPRVLGGVIRLGKIPSLVGPAGWTVKAAKGMLVLTWPTPLSPAALVLTLDPAALVSAARIGVAGLYSTHANLVAVSNVGATLDPGGLSGSVHFALVPA